jgi:hypothetical protein
MLKAAESKGIGSKLGEKKEAPKDTQLQTATIEPGEKKDETAKPAEGEAGAGGEKKDETAGAGGEEENPYSLEEDGFVGAKDLASKIDANEALKAALPADIRNEIMANARLAQVASEYRKLFTSPAEAKVVSEAAGEYGGLMEAFVSVQQDVAKGTTALINKMLQVSVKRDADGNPILKDGKPQSDGTVGRFLNECSLRYIDRNIVQKVQALNDDTVSSALDLVLQSVGLRSSDADKGEDKDPALAAREAKVAEREKSIARQQEASRVEQVKQYNEGVNGDRNSMVDAEIGRLLSLATGINDFTRQNVSKAIKAGIKKAVQASTSFKLRQDQIERLPIGAKRRAEELDHATRFTRENLVTIAKPILREAGIEITGRVAAKKETQAAREQAARSETITGAAAQPKVTATSHRDIDRNQVAETLKAKLGRVPSGSEIDREVMILAVERANRK